jgi:hypothetical protein
MNWGDGGRLHVFFRPGDAIVADFSRTVSVRQTY